MEGKIISQAIKAVISQQEFIPIATIDKDGCPNVANKFMISLEGDNIYFGDFANGRTWRNLKHLPNVSIAVMDANNLIDYQINGKATLLNSDVDYNKILVECSSRQVRFVTKRLIEAVRKENRKIKYEVPLLEKVIIWQVKVDEVVELGPSAELRQQNDFFTRGKR
ncbi:MAG: pyridoxamine 5'-phosphate oxidase family protein [Candidatus Omnitrophica bacterium]|nr:pyridoxamine 5'-phosphate oxidase family protein [Candidatus Omnitrophota bacterium]